MVGYRWIDRERISCVNTTQHVGQGRIRKDVEGGGCYECLHLLRYRRSRVSITRSYAKNHYRSRVIVDTGITIARRITSYAGFSVTCYGGKLHSARNEIQCLHVR